MSAASTTPGDRRQPFAHLTDILGSLAMIRRYSIISLLFALADHSDPQETVRLLEQALAALVLDVPWLAGRVVFEGQDATHSGIRHIIPHQGTIPLVVKHLGSLDRFSSLAQIQDAGFPMAALGAEFLVPPIAASWDSTNPDVVAPVLILQASFIQGGLILTVCSNHTTMDMTGLGIVIGFIAKACRGERLTPDEVAQANQDRRNAVPLLGDDFQDYTELEDSIAKPKEHTGTAEEPGRVPQASPPKWVYFGLSSTALQDMKREASRQDVVPFITTDDAVTALCWQRIQATRRADVRLIRIVSMRKVLGLEGYTGHAVDAAYGRIADVGALTLGTVAGSLRATLRDETALRRHVRAFATLLGRLDDKDGMQYGASADLGVDVCISSYTNLYSCSASFGALLGVPVAARRPRMAPYPGLLYLMPKDAKGDVAAAFCLAEDDVGRLRQDPVFTKYATYIG